MSEPKFTPGPWKLEARRDIWDEFECWLHPINLHIHDKISDEDAHLIAAAPELYDALEYCIKQIPEFGDVPGIKAALSKARGEG